MMQRFLLSLLLTLTLSLPLFGQTLTPGHVISYIPFTPCVGSPISFTAIDTSGLYTLATHSWSFGDGGSGWSYTQQPTVTHVYTAPGTYWVHFSAWDSLSFSYEYDSLQIVVDSICANHDNISGLTYYDSDGNGVQNSGEPVYPNRLIEITPGPYYLTSDQNGMFSVNLTPGTYNFAVVAPTYFGVSQPSGGSYTVTSAGNGSLHPNNDFGLTPINGINDLRVHYSTNPPVPGFNRTFYVYYANVGTTLLNGTVTLQYDPAMNFISAANGGTQSGNTVTWNVGNLLPGDYGTVTALVYTPLTTVVGSSLVHTATINPIVGDTTPSNNVYTDTSTVVASYDPNDKSVSPRGVNASGDVAIGTTLTYTIRFQNTGTYYATDVIVRDTLDPDLDQSTLEVLGSSHPMTWHNDFGKLAFEFFNIMLPDSNTNEPGSHGSVTYRIAPKAGLPLGTELTNTGHIYFDFNAPIVTNTTLNTLANLVAVDPAHNAMHLTVVPHPFGDRAQLRFDNASGDQFALIIHDLSGRVVLQASGITGNSYELDATDLSAGMYLFTLQNSAGVQVSGKVVKQ